MRFLSLIPALFLFLFLFLFSPQAFGTFIGGGVTPNSCSGGQFANAINGVGILTCAAAGGGGGATAALDNLAAVAINTSLLPGADGSVDIGSSTKRFQNEWMTGNLITGGTAVQRSGMTRSVSIQGTGNTAFGFEAFNTGAGASSFSALTLGEDYATGKHGGIEYANNSFFEGTIYTNNQLSLAAKTGAVGGLLVNTEAASAPIIFGTTSIERARITDSYVQLKKVPVFLGDTTTQTQRGEQVLSYGNSTGNGGAITTLNVNAAGYSEFNFQEDAADQSKGASFEYLNSGFTPSGIFKPGQLIMFSRSAATGGIGIGSLGVEAPVMLFTGSAERFRVTAPAVTAVGTNLVVDTAGKGLQIKSGTNGMAGTTTLVAGTKAVANTLVTANTICLATIKTLGTVAVPSGLQCATSVGVGITLTASAPTDTSTVQYMLVEAN